MHFGTTYGTQHYAMASMRYDANAYMLPKVDTAETTLRFMDQSLVMWTTHYSKPYVIG
jgi:hypothetical protein